MIDDRTSPERSQAERASASSAHTSFLAGGAGFIAIHGIDLLVSTESSSIRRASTSSGGVPGGGR
jgi:hypothetical protein